jgi:hypothetical protein
VTAVLLVVVAVLFAARQLVDDLTRFGRSASLFTSALCTFGALVPLPAPLLIVVLAVAGVCAAASLTAVARPTGVV